MVRHADVRFDRLGDRRDNHLRSPDFFAADSFPSITFQSTRVTRTGDDLRIEGSLSIRGVTRPAVLTGAFTGFTRSAQGEQRVGFQATTRINRLDYGVATQPPAGPDSVIASATRSSR